MPEILVGILTLLVIWGLKLIVQYIINRHHMKTIIEECKKQDMIIESKRQTEIQEIENEEKERLDLIDNVIKQVNETYPVYRNELNNIVSICTEQTLKHRYREYLALKYSNQYLNNIYEVILSDDLTYDDQELKERSLTTLKLERDLEHFKVYYKKKQNQEFEKEYLDTLIWLLFSKTAVEYFGTIYEANENSENIYRWFCIEREAYLNDEVEIGKFTCWLIKNKKVSFHDVHYLEALKYTKMLLMEETEKIQYEAFEVRIQQKFVNNQKKVSLDDVDLMTGIEFERFVSELFKEMGYLIEFTKVSGDQGIDIIAEKGSEKSVYKQKDIVVAFQIERFKK